ncbi:MAG: acyltransferase family protein [Oscillospiraceae bacterium]|nr:acyltransferase family protein [Oscillospiraceae bacterium]
MTNKNQLGALDNFRLIAALLVIAIHTSPLWSIDETANLLLTGVFARVAVPFFFAVTGYFTDFANPSKLRRSAAKTILVYAAAIVVYLPFGTYGASVKMLLFDGAFYHLWYFPATVIGILIVSALVRLPKTAAFAIAGALYIIGLFGDSYYNLTAGLPPVRAFYDVVFKAFSYTRNGIFFAPLFLLSGEALAKRERPMNRIGSGAGLALSIWCLAMERLLLAKIAFSPRDNMFICLFPATLCLIGFLTSVKAKPRPCFRSAAMWVYILHPIAMHIADTTAERLGSDNFFAEHSLLRFVLTAALSYPTAFALTAVKPALARLSASLRGVPREVKHGNAG